MSCLKSRKIFEKTKGETMCILSDFHIHTKFSGDSKELPENVVKKAIDLGLKSICFTDHQDFDYIFSDLDFNLDTKSYFEYMKNLKEKFKSEIEILIGVEIGIEPYLKEKLNSFVNENPYDFVIGSSHIVNRQDPYYPEYFKGRTDKEAFSEYFQSILENLKVYDNFDVYGHLDYVVRYSENKDKNYSYEAFSDYIDEILKKLIAKGKGIEVNSAAYRYGLDNPNPHQQAVKRYKELGGEIITVGSDAHQSEYVASGFDRVCQVLKNAGFSYYTVFKNRRPEFISIN